MWEIKRYNPDDKKNWDAFVENSRNATFLFARDYMDYHSDRFDDHSILAFRNGKLCAILPANESGDSLFTHQGLTYGGWIWSPKGLDVNDIFLLWSLWLEYCRGVGFVRIIYKPLPFIYAVMPSQEDIYMLYLSGAKLKVTDVSSAMDVSHNPGFNKLQKRHLNALGTSDIVKLITHQDLPDISCFHNLLTECLDTRHNTVPVHSLQELVSLMNKFPDNIKIWTLYSNGTLEAGICGYITTSCLHCQYIATSEEGRKNNVLARVVSTMIKYCEGNDIRYLDFGISNEEYGRLLNTGLNRQKTSYGASGVVYQRYEINVNDALMSWPTSLWPRQ